MGEIKVIFVKISQNVIKSPLKIYLILQISVQGLWHVRPRNDVMLFFLCFFVLFNAVKKQTQNNLPRPEDHWSCIAHLIAEDMLKSAVIEEKKFKNIECK